GSADAPASRRQECVPYAGTVRRPTARSGQVGARRQGGRRRFGLAGTGRIRRRRGSAATAGGRKLLLHRGGAQRRLLLGGEVLPPGGGGVAVTQHLAGDGGLLGELRLHLV